MKVLVTGGAGFIGSHVVDLLLADGHEVSVADDLSSGRRENLPAGVPLHELRVQEPAFDALVAETRPDAVAHLAAQIDVRVSVADPLTDAEINVLGTIRVARACARNGVARIVFASTGGAIYGEQTVFPAPEEHLERPVSPYGVAKLCAEHYLRCLHLDGGTSWCATRFANVYGPRQDPHGEAGVVAIFCGRLLAGEEAVIYGDGGQTRDYVFVGDVARAMRDALTSGHVGPVNVGTGIETDVNTLYAELARILGGVDRPPRHADARPGEQRRSSVDPALAERLWRWRPEVPLSEGLRRTAEFFRERGR